MLAAGSRIDGRYHVVRFLGRGAMGSVLLARDENLDRLVAIKLIGDLAATVPDFEARFRREAAALAAIRHPNVVQVYAAGRHEGTMFFVMELVEGRDLDWIVNEHASNGASVPLPRALTILEQVASGLHAIHLAGFVHRDVKPANVVIEEATGRPVVVDLGLAASIQEARHEERGVGTPAYAAPEQVGDTIDATKLGPRADVYALACTAFEVFAGRPPFVANDADVVVFLHLTKAPPLLSQLRPDLVALDGVLARALEKDPGRRFATAPELVSALREASGVRDEAPSLVGRPPLADVLRVLVVDDDEDFTKLISTCARIAFRDAKVEVESVTSGAAALERVSTLRPHLLLLDYQMPGLNGIETLSRLRALPFGDAVRVVVVSAHQQQWRFSVLGVNDFILKGDSPAALTQSLRAVRDKYGFQ